MSQIPSVAARSSAGPWPTMPNSSTPTGRWRGIDGFVERIGAYQTAAPGAKVVPASGIDAHNDVVRYAWTIVNAEGQELMDGIDVAERTTDGRLRRILMFHGPLPAEH